MNTRARRIRRRRRKARRAKKPNMWCHLSAMSQSRTYYRHSENPPTHPDKRCYGCMYEDELRRSA